MDDVGKDLNDLYICNCYIQVYQKTKHSCTCRNGKKRKVIFYFSALKNPPAKPIDGVKHIGQTMCFSSC